MLDLISLFTNKNNDLTYQTASVSTASTTWQVEDDILWRTMFHNEGGGTFSLIHSTGPSAIPFTQVSDYAAASGFDGGENAGAMGRVVAFVDYDGDGRLDIFVGTYKENANELWHNDGGSPTSFSQVTDSVVTQASNGRYTTSAAFGDFDNDGRVDIFVGTSFNSNRLFHNLGAGTFELVSGNSLDRASADAFAVAFVDLVRRWGGGGLQRLC